MHAVTEGHEITHRGRHGDIIAVTREGDDVLIQYGHPLGLGWDRVAIPVDAVTWLRAVLGRVVG